MSQPADASVVELEQIVAALIGLARDRGATSAQQELLGGIWIELQASMLSGATPAGLHRHVTSLAADLLGVDGLLSPENAPYGGFWQEVESATVASPVSSDTPSPFDERRHELRAFLATDRSPRWEVLAARGLTTLMPFSDACGTIEELARIAAPGPYLQTMALLPALRDDERERVSAGEASWALAVDPLVMSLDSATSVAIVGGDGIFELVGAERELLATRDASRPLGVVTGGDAGRRLGDSTSLPLVRRRLLTALAFEALGVIDAVGSTSPAARALAVEAARRVEADDPDADLFAAAAKAFACDVAFAVTTTAMTSSAADTDEELVRLHERARAIRAWEASPAQLRTELGEAFVRAGDDE